MYPPSLPQDEQVQEPVASTAEKKLQAESGVPVLPTPALATIERLLVEAAIQRPEADALIGSFGSLSYADLLIRAQNIAVALRQHGVAAGQFVGVAMDQSPVMITSIAGILLAGAAYVPLSRDMLEDARALQHIRASGMALILCDRGHGTGSCTVWHDFGATLDASRLEQQTMPASAETRMPPTTLDSAAAMLFRRIPGETSVGVVIPHRAVSRLVSGNNLLPFNNAAFSQNETFLLHPVAGTRTSLLELWGSLLHGGTLALASDGISQRGPLQNGLAAEHLAESIRLYGVSTLCLSVSGLHDLIQAEPQIFSRLNNLVIELEQDGKIATLSPQHLEWLAANHRRLRVVNTYGTLETSGYATSYLIPKSYVAQGSVPIGRPIDGIQAVILDRELFPTREGEIGELAFSGDGVVSGYLQDRDATAQRFLRKAMPNDTSDSHLFLTGERARWRSDGLLEWHGKSAKHHLAPPTQDDDTKDSGAFDVEAMLMSQQRVRDAAILEHVNEIGARQHVAFITLDDGAGQPETQAAFEESLRRVLPETAMPMSFQYVQSIPRDGTGASATALLEQHWKQEQDRAHAQQQQEQAEQEKSSEMLQQVSSLWLRLLQRVSIGADENFFDAGGTQVQMIRMHVALNRLYPGAITMANLSVLTTIRSIHDHLMRRTG